jgi:hypothetical protein
MNGISFPAICFGMTVTDKFKYAKSLFERLNEGVIVPLKKIEIEHEDGIWIPEENQCHANASILARTYPIQLECVRGWLVFDFRLLNGEVNFMHHSVVREKETGRLYDVTPQVRAQPEYLFIDAKLSEENYSSLVEKMTVGEMLIFQVT